MLQLRRLGLSQNIACLLLSFLFCGVLVIVVDWLTAFNVFQRQMAILQRNDNKRNIVQLMHGSDKRLQFLTSAPGTRVGSSAQWINASKPPTLNRKPKNVGLFTLTYNLEGHMLTDAGAAQLVAANLTVSVVHSFSPWIDDKIREMFFDPTGENKYHATAPALVWFKNQAIVAQRIWISQYERDTSFNKAPRYWNTWQENRLWEYRFDEDYEPIGGDMGGFLGIPAPMNCPYDYRADGLMDPRWIIVNDRLYLTFHMWLVDVAERDIRGRMFIWDYERKRIDPLLLQRPDTLGLPLQRGEINWIPLDVNGTLFFVYSMDPLRIMQCSVRGTCEFVQLPAGHTKFPFDVVEDRLRGGSQFILYRYPYYIAAAHSQLVVPDNFSYYTAHLIVLAVAPRFRLVWVSAPLSVDKGLLFSAPIVRDHTIKVPFLYPVGAVLWNSDVLDLGVHLSDSRGFVLRMHGVAALMSRVIKLDAVNVRARRSSVGPPNRAVQQLVHRYATAYFNVTFS